MKQRDDVDRLRWMKRQTDKRVERKPLTASEVFIELCAAEETIKELTKELKTLKERYERQPYSFSSSGLSGDTFQYAYGGYTISIGGNAATGVAVRSESSDDSIPF